VTYGRAKLAKPARAALDDAHRPFRAGSGAASRASVDIIGPDDSTAGAEDEDVPALLRAVFTAAGGTHDDWDAYDRTMAEQRRAAVLVTPRRVYSN